MYIKIFLGVVNISQFTTILVMGWKIASWKKEVEMNQKENAKDIQNLKIENKKFVSKDDLKEIKESLKEINEKLFRIATNMLIEK